MTVYKAPSLSFEACTKCTRSAMRNFRTCSRMAFLCMEPGVHKGVGRKQHTNHGRARLPDTASCKTATASLAVANFVFLAFRSPPFTVSEKASASHLKEEPTKSSLMTAGDPPPHARVKYSGLKACTKDPVPPV